MKPCRKCGEEKSLEEFSKKKANKDGRSCECYECKRKRDNARNRKNGIPERKPAKLKPPPLSRIWVKKCIDTGVLFVTRRNKQVRCKEAQREYTLLKGRDDYNKNKEKYLYNGRIKWVTKNNNRFRRCKMCNKEYDFINKGTVLYCSDKCKRLAASISKERHKTHKCRAIHFGVEYERINKLTIFKRDKWKCQACGIKTQKNDHLKDNAAELDHIIPMSRGGGHIKSNVQTLCRKCNGEKGNKLIGQLRIAI